MVLQVHLQKSRGGKAAASFLKRGEGWTGNVGECTNMGAFS